MLIENQLYVDSGDIKGFRFFVIGIGCQRFFISLKLAYLFIFLYLQARLSRKECLGIYSGVDRMVLYSAHS
jgi:hypothetical protein